MSDQGHHEQADDGSVNVHIHSWKLYAGVLAALLFLTVITVAAAYVDIDGFLAMGGEVKGVGAWNLTVAILIATAKASFVVIFFMHLKDDSRFNALILLGAILFIGIFFAYTMNDTSVRGSMDAYNGVIVDPDTGLAAPGGVAAPMPGQRLYPGMQPPAEEEAADGEAAAGAEGGAVEPTEAAAEEEATAAEEADIESEAAGEAVEQAEAAEGEAAEAAESPEAEGAAAEGEGEDSAEESAE